MSVVIEKPHEKGIDGESPLDSVIVEKEVEKFLENEIRLELASMEPADEFMDSEMKIEEEARTLHGRSGRGLKRRAENDEIVAEVENEPFEDGSDGELSPSHKKKSPQQSALNSGHARTAAPTRKTKTANSTPSQKWKKIDGSSTFLYQPPDGSGESKSIDTSTSPRQLIFKSGWPKMPSKKKNPSFVISEPFASPPRGSELQFHPGLPKSILKKIEAGVTLAQDQQTQDKQEPTSHAPHISDSQIFWSEHIISSNSIDTRPLQSPVFVSMYPTSTSTFSTTPSTTNFSFINVESPFSPSKSSRQASAQSTTQDANLPTTGLRGRRRSPIWTYFALTNEKYVCQVCKDTNLTGTFSQSVTTRTLKKHLSSHHPELPIDFTQVPDPQDHHVVAQDGMMEAEPDLDHLNNIHSLDMENGVIHASNSSDGIDI